jgi:two-component system nitrate/nitrite response regulator NarL
MTKPALAANGSASSAITVAIVDGDPLARRALCACLTAEHDFKIIGEASNASEGMDLVGRQRPDQVLLEFVAPDRTVGDAIGELVRRSPGTACIVLALREDEDAQIRALRAGASGWLLKSIDLELLPRILRGVRNGEAAVTRALGTRLLREAVGVGPGDMRRFRPVRSSLTEREWEVADLLVEGATTSQIAETLQVSTATVRTHVKHILGKLGMHSREEAIRYVQRVRNSSWA